MRPALQRLLARPSSLECLRYLVGTPALDAPVRDNRGCIHGGPIARRHQSAQAISTRDIQCGEAGEDYDERAPRISILPQNTKHKSSAVRKVERKPRKLIPLKHKAYGPWSEKRWTRDELEFESNLDDRDTRKLLHHEEHKNDTRLWAYLLEYRQRRYGESGVTMFWNAIYQNHIAIHTKGYLADKLWSTFLSLGLHDYNILYQLWRYADELSEKDKRRWPKLYVQMIGSLLLTGCGAEAVQWHDRLHQHHPPNYRTFAELCRVVTLKKGDMAALREIYKRNEHRKCYSKVVPVLCTQEDFKAAVDWHFFFIKCGDLPPKSKLVEPLLQFLAVYDRPQAARVTKSLVEAGVPFEVDSSKLQDNTKISREMVNLIHGATFNVTVKTYNDNLGARWFATRWISLDVAMNAMHALGVQEIGPLSLQALARRELDAKGVSLRIKQLGDLGISIGKSKFSIAVDYFARYRNEEFLQGLLESDQHPDGLEDSTLQESLLSQYARAKDWAQYRRTLEIQSIGSKYPDIEKENLVLRSLVSERDIDAIKKNLFQMHTSGTPIQAKSIAHILRIVLRIRRPGRRPMSLWGKVNDLETSIEMLKGIMMSGSFVPVTYWREIIRRLGMLGRTHELEKLCLYLATWYGPTGDHALGHRRPHRYRVPRQVSTSHPLHPVKILFPVSLQKAIVEWGFIHAFRRQPIHTNGFRSIRPKSSTPTVTSGISLLKQLHHQGVHVDGKSVRKAILNRVITYYGSGRSNKPYNRIARERIGMTLDEIAVQIDQALGGRYFTRVDLEKLVQSRATTTLQRLHRRRLRRLQAPRGEIRSLPEGAPASFDG
jgi:hypothetical protein